MRGASGNYEMMRNHDIDEVENEDDFEAMEVDESNSSEPSFPRGNRFDSLR